MFYNPRNSTLMPFNYPEYPGLPEWDSNYYLDWQDPPANAFPPDYIVFEPSGVYFFYGRPTLGLGGFWGSLWDGIKGAGRWVQGAWESWGEDVYEWVEQRGGAEAVKKGACVFDQACRTYYILNRVDAKTQATEFRRATATECSSRRSYDSSGIKGWNTPKDCVPGAPPTPPVKPPETTQAGVLGSFGPWIEKNWPYAVAGSLGLYFLTRRRGRPLYSPKRRY